MKSVTLLTQSAALTRIAMPTSDSATLEMVLCVGQVVVPILIVLVAIPVGLLWQKLRDKDGAKADD